MKKFLKILLTVIITLVVTAGLACAWAWQTVGQKGAALLTSPQTESWVSQQSDRPAANSGVGTWYLEAPKRTWHHGQLTASFIDQHTNKTVILLHGYGQSHVNMYRFAYFFNQRGYNVLLPDSRGHGHSKGQVSFGYFEKKDLVAWCRQVSKRLGADQQIVVLGVSMGASTALQASPLLPKQVKAIVADSAYTTIRAELLYQAQHNAHLDKREADLLLKSTDAQLPTKAGFRLADVSCVTALRKTPIPVLFIHGASDTFVPVWMTKADYRADRGPKELWLVPGVGHTQAYTTDQDAYQQHLLKFLNKYL